MTNGIHHTVRSLIIRLLIITLACNGATPAIPSVSSEPEYRYDDLPTMANESSIIAEYQAISQWSTLDLSYYSVNGTEKLEGDIEKTW